MRQLSFANAPLWSSVQPVLHDAVAPEIAALSKVSCCTCVCRFFHWTVDQFLEVFNPPNAVVRIRPAKLPVMQCSQLVLLMHI